MASCRQVERDIVRVGPTESIQIYRGLDPHPLLLATQVVRTKQIVESQTSPPRDRAPAFNANQACNLLCVLGSDS